MWNLNDISSNKSAVSEMSDEDKTPEGFGVQMEMLGNQKLVVNNIELSSFSKQSPTKDEDLLLSTGRRSDKGSCDPEPPDIGGVKGSTELNGLNSELDIVKLKSCQN